MNTLTVKNGVDIHPTDERKLQMAEVVFELPPYESIFPSSTSAETLEFIEQARLNVEPKGRFISDRAALKLVEERGLDNFRFIEFNKDLVLNILSLENCTGLRVHLCSAVKKENEEDYDILDDEVSVIIEPIGEDYQGKRSLAWLAGELNRDVLHDLSGSNQNLRAEIGGIGTLV